MSLLFQYLGSFPVAGVSGGGAGVGGAGGAAAGDGASADKVARQLQLMKVRDLLELSSPLYITYIL